MNALRPPPSQLTAAELDRMEQVYETVLAQLRTAGGEPQQDPGWLARAFGRAIEQAAYAGEAWALHLRA